MSLAIGYLFRYLLGVEPLVCLVCWNRPIFQCMHFGDWIFWHVSWQLSSFFGQVVEVVILPRIWDERINDIWQFRFTRKVYCESMDLASTEMRKMLTPMVSFFFFLEFSVSILFGYSRYHVAAFQLAYCLCHLSCLEAFLQYLCRNI